MRIADPLRPDALLFGESTGRVIATSAEPDALLALASERGVPARLVGETGGDRLVIGPEPGPAHAGPWIDAAIEALHGRWARAIPDRLEGR